MLMEFLNMTAAELPPAKAPAKSMAELSLLRPRQRPSPTLIQGLAEGNQLRGSAEGTQLRCSAEQPVAQSNFRSRSRSRQLAGPLTDDEDMQTSWELHQQRRSRWRGLRKGVGRGRSAQQLAAGPMNDPEADRDDPHASN